MEKNFLSETPQTAVCFLVSGNQSNIDTLTIPYFRCVKEVMKNLFLLYLPTQSLVSDTYQFEYSSRVTTFPSNIPILLLHFQELFYPNPKSHSTNSGVFSFPSADMDLQVQVDRTWN